MSCTEPHEVVRRLYALISGARDEARAWDEVASLFLPEAVLRSELTLPDGSHQSGVWTVAEFCDAAASEYAESGFWEREIAVRLDCFENIAQVWTTYESRVGTPDSDPVNRGINAVHLLRQDGAWRIASIVFQIERGTGGIPTSYLPKETGAA
jgi:hypothetical protein